MRLKNLAKGASSPAYIYFALAVTQHTNEFRVEPLFTTSFLHQIFKLDVLGESPSGELAVVPSSHVLQELSRILDTAQEPSSCPVGVLTSEHRDTWSQARERLTEGVCVCVCVCACVRACMRACMRACVRVSLVVIMLSLPTRPCQPSLSGCDRASPVYHLPRYWPSQAP